MQILLPPKRFKHAIDLQSIKKNNAYPHAEPHEEPLTNKEHRPIISKYSMLPEKMQNANLNDNLCIQICIYLEASKARARPTVYVNSCKINNSLLIKADYLQMPESKNSQLRLEIIKKMHDQPAVDHTNTEKTLNMLYCHYYWPDMRAKVE